MDPITAAFNFGAEVAKLLQVAMLGQTAEQKAKMWDWFITDTARVRKFLKMDEEPK